MLLTRNCLHWRRSAGALALACLLVMAAPAAADHETLLVSRANGLNGVGGDADSTSASISADGRLVAFTSNADNLSSFDNNGVANVFLRDLQTGTTELVSRVGGRTLTGGDGKSSGPSISTSGRFVAFTSDADNLNTIDNNSVLNVFLRDRDAPGTFLVSIAPGGAAADASSFNASISADGRFIAFESDANNLSSADNDSVRNVIVRDTLFGQNILVSRASGSTGAGADGGSFAPRISANGRFVAFESDADNLSGADNNSFRNVFVRDIQRNETTFVSRISDPVLSPAAAQFASPAANDHSGKPSISADGRFVAFSSRADNLSGADDNSLVNVFVRDLQGRTTTFVGPTISPAFSAETGPASAISADGRFVAFTSEIDSLSGADDDRFLNVFIRDLQAASTKFISRAGNLGSAPSQIGAPGNGDSTGPSVSADGSFVAFESFADNFSGLDNDLFSNVFRRHHLVKKLRSGRCANKLRGTNKGETLTGTNKGDRISGRGGNDVLRGLDGADCLSGGKGKDLLSGGKGNDRLSGGSGRDRITGGKGRDRVKGGSGRDRINVRGGGKDRVNCGRGRDRVKADASDVVSSNCETVKVG